MKTSQLVENEYPHYCKTYFDAAGEVKLVEELEICLHDFIRFVQNIPLDKFDYRYAEGKWTIKEIIQHIIDTNREHLQMAYQFDDILVTHAGVSSVWLDDIVVDWNVDSLDATINDLFRYQPLKVEYRQFKQVGDQVYGASGFGDETFQGPLWIRPRSLMNANYDTLRTQIRQIVGHTGQKQIDIEGKSTGGRYYFIDTMPKQYLIITDGVVSLGTIN